MQMDTEEENMQVVAKGFWAANRAHIRVFRVMILKKHAVDSAAWKLYFGPYEYWFYKYCLQKSI